MGSLLMYFMYCSVYYTDCVCEHIYIYIYRYYLLNVHSRKLETVLVGIYFGKHGFAHVYLVTQPVAGTGSHNARRFRTQRVPKQRSTLLVMTQRVPKQGSTLLVLTQRVPKQRSALLVPTQRVPKHRSALLVMT